MRAMKKVLRQVISFCLDVLRTLLVVIVLVLLFRKPDNVAHDRLLLIDLAVRVAPQKLSRVCAGRCKSNRAFSWVAFHK